jgi:predicted Zn-dependent protease
VRAVAVLGALSVAAWCGLGGLQVRWLERAEAILLRPEVGTAEGRERVQQLVDRARILNVSSVPDQLEAQLLTATPGREQEAIERLTAIAREHPDDINAWARLAASALDRDPAAFRLARREMERLSPPRPSPG